MPGTPQDAPPPRRTGMGSTDAPLWVEYDETTRQLAEMEENPPTDLLSLLEAGETRERLLAARKDLACRIVESWLSWFRWYVRDSSPRHWHQDTREEYLSEVVAAAMEAVPDYDSGKGANFGTFCRWRLQPVRWSLIGAQQHVPTGVEVQRMRADAEHAVALARQEAGQDPSMQVVADFIAARHGKKVSPGRAARLLAPIQKVALDEVSEAEYGLLGLEPTPEAAYLRAEEQAAASTRVNAALAVAARTPLEQALAQHLMHGEPSRAELAKEHGLSTDQVATATRRLKDRLRAALSQPDEDSSNSAA